MSGLTPDTLFDIKTVFAKLPQIDKVILYGSRAKGNYRKGSDIDITLIGKNLNLKNSVYPLIDKLDELYLPYTFDISILKHIDNQNLIEHINKVGKVFYKKEKGLPDGWVVKTLGEVCEFIRGPFGGSLRKSIFVDNGIAVYEQQHAIYNQFDQIRYFITHEKFKEMQRFELFSGDLIMSCSGTMGKMAIVPKTIKKGIINQALLKLTASKKLEVEYLKLWMESKRFQDNIAKYSKGAAIKNVASVKTLKQISIPIPPIAEQKRIVSILDKAFTEITKAKTNAEQNLKNTKELFKNYLQGVFENKGDDWVEKKLGEVANVEYGFTGKAKNNGDFRYVRITDIDNDGGLITRAKKYISNSIKVRKFILKNNDLLMARTGATFAKVLLYEDVEPSVFASYLIKIEFTEDIENEFYWYFTKTSAYWEQAESLSSGAAQPHFNGKALKQVLFPYPKNIDKQKILISKFRNLSSETKKLETIYQKKIAILDELKKSVLQKAFNGEL